MASRNDGIGYGCCCTMGMMPKVLPSPGAGCAQSPPRQRPAEGHGGAEGFHSLEGNMCGTAMRGADALPGSKATSRAKGSHRNLGDHGSGRRHCMLREYGGPRREGEEP